MLYSVPQCNTHCSNRTHTGVCLKRYNDESIFIILYIFLTCQVLQSKFLKPKVAIFSVV